MNSFNSQPILQSDILLLRPLALQDFDELFSVASDPLIWEQHPASDRYKKNVFLTFFEEAMNGKSAFTIIDKKTNQIIGSSRYYEMDYEKLEIVIGYSFIARKYWGGLYNSDKKRLMLNHAFKHFRTVHFHVDEKNIRSQKAMVKIGGKKTGQFIKPGRQNITYIYSINL